MEVRSRGGDAVALHFEISQNGMGQVIRVERRVLQNPFQFGDVPGRRSYLARQNVIDRLLRWLGGSGGFG